MTTAPFIDPTWHRVHNDTFSKAKPCASTPFDRTSDRAARYDVDDGDSSDWSYSEEEQLITLDLGTERIARRALLGYTAGLDPGSGDAQASTSSSVSGTTAGQSSFTGSSSTATAGGRNLRAITAIDSTTAEAGSNANAAASHLGKGKMLSITGLDTATPLMKIDDTVLRGRRMDLLGSEILLLDEKELTRPRGKQHRLQPIPPSTLNSSEASGQGEGEGEGEGERKRATVNSSTTRTRILFRPIYDPSSRETSQADKEGYAALRKLAKAPQSYNTSGTVSTVAATERIQAERGGREEQEEEQRRLASLANLMGTAGGKQEEEAQAQSTPQKGVGRGKYKRKEYSESEQIIRAAERKVRKAVKELRREQEQQQLEEAAREGEGEVEGEGQGEEGQQAEEQIDEDPQGQGQVHEPRPPPSFSEQ